MSALPHVVQHDRRSAGSAIDGLTTRYALFDVARDRPRPACAAGARSQRQGCATTTEAGLLPAATVAGVIGVNAPPAAIVYCDTVLLPAFAT